jgi:hypothetical protein
MAAAGHGRIVGVTSGSGWRAADAGAYSVAKRAVASLTWQLGRHAPPGVTVNAISPIALTRMVTAALPRLLEAVHADPGSSSLAQLLHAIGPGALAAAEAAQASGGGTNPRFGSAFEASPEPLPPAAVDTCAVVSDRPDLAAAVASALEGRVRVCTTVDVDDPAAAAAAAGFDGAAGALAAAVDRAGPLDAVVVALSGGASGPPDGPAWQRVLAEHDDLAEQIHADAAWVRAVAERSAATDRPMRVVTLVDAVTAGGRSRAQAAAQLSRSGRGATGDRVSAFAVSVEGAGPASLRPAAELAAHLVCSPNAAGLAGAELVAGEGWVGVRSHPRPAGSLVLGGARVPDWFDAALRRIIGAADGGTDREEAP